MKKPRNSPAPAQHRRTRFLVAGLAGLLVLYLVLLPRLRRMAAQTEQLRNVTAARHVLAKYY